MKRLLTAATPGLTLLLIFGGVYFITRFLTAEPPSVPDSERVERYVVQGSENNDQSPALQRLLNSGADVVDLGREGRIKASVTVPANVTLRSSGAVLTPVPGSRHVVATSGEGVSLQGIIIDGSEPISRGATTALVISHSKATVSDVHVKGNGHMYGLTTSKSGPLEDITVKRSFFEGTSYGILKTRVETKRFTIENNNFTRMLRGDAIELNAGGDTDLVIRGNSVSGVRSGGNLNAGIGIGVAGEGDYGRLVSQMSMGCRIVDNSLSDIEGEAIHLEVMSACLIEGNRITGGPAEATKGGIALYGSAGNTVANNSIIRVQTGIRDSLGVRDGRFVASASGNRHVNNSISKCATAIESFVSGEGAALTATGNVVDGCTNGIRHAGSAHVRLTDNTISGTAATTGFAVDLRPKAEHLVSSSPGLVFERNSVNAEPAQSPLSSEGRGDSAS